MKKCISLVLFLTSFLISSLSFALDTYTFRAPVNQGFMIPGLDFWPEVTGTLKVEQDSMYPGQLTIKQLKLDFENAPSLSTSQSFKYDYSTHSAVIKNQWIFRAVRVEINNLNTLMPTNIDLKVRVETGESFVSNSSVDTPPLELFSINATLEKDNRFVLADIYTQQINGKLATFRLNANYSNSMDPISGTIEEGAQIKIMWLGHGERYVYIPTNIPQPNVKMIAIVVTNPGQTVNGEMLSVRYEHNGMIEETPPQRLEDILMNAYGIL